MPGYLAEQRNVSERAAYRSPSRLTNAMTSFLDVSRICAALLVLASLVLAGCSHSESEPTKRADGGAAEAPTATASREPVDTAVLTVVDGRLRRTVWTTEGKLYGLGRRAAKLRGVVQAPFVGTLSPAAVPNPASERLIAYNSFFRKRPVLRLHDIRSRRDSVLDEGSYTIAWSRRGGLAYFKGLTPRVRDPARYRGHVLVRASATSKPVRWTAEPGRYAVSAWAGDRLVVHELTQAWPNIVVFDGPNARRVLAEGAGLVALSPDGTRAFITKRPDPSPIVSVVDVETGDELATFAFADQVDPIRAEPINYVSDSGAWGGDTVIAAVTKGLAVFRVTDDEITLVELLGVDPEAFPLGLTEPKSDETGRYVVASAEITPKPRAAFSRVALMECDRVERHCVLGRGAPSYLPPRLVYNPSRPFSE